jgi:hypothetical protein
VDGDVGPHRSRPRREMSSGARRLFDHPAVRKLLSERLLVTASALYFRDGGRSRPFWRVYIPASFALFAALLLASLAFVRLGIR